MMNCSRMFRRGRDKTMDLLRRDQAHWFVTDTLIENIDNVRTVKGISKKTKIFLECGIQDVVHD